MYDLLLKNGTYPDFKAGEMKKGNIAVKDGKIAYIGEDMPDAEKITDAEGMIVSPGFIDIHMHEENFAEICDRPDDAGNGCNNCLRRKLRHAEAGLILF